MKTLDTAHGSLRMPAFLPDGTRAVVRTLDATDIAACGVECLMINVLHLSNTPGTSLVESQGGAHAFMGWSGPLASDSGGFQALSLASGPGKSGSVSSDGITYRHDKGASKKTLTPEKCIQRQFQLGTDIMFCLDHCTHPDMDAAHQRESVANTLAWAQRCQAEFQRRVERLPEERAHPFLFAVIQGGASSDLRKECADRLFELGFDGYGFGGWPVDSGGKLVDAVREVAELTPVDTPLHGLGIGSPANLVAARRMGYRLFDCVMPTRDARHRRLFAFREGAMEAGLHGDFYESIGIGDPRHKRSQVPVEEGCDCLCCRHYTRAYLHHLFEIREQAGYRLATIHNLRFYARLMDALRGEAPDG